MSGNLGPYLRDRRTKLGLTQERVAMAVGISRSHLSQIESGKIGLPSPETRRKLAGVLAIAHVDLLIAADELSADEAVAKCSSLQSELERVVERLGPEARSALLTIARLLSREQGDRLIAPRERSE